MTLLGLMISSGLVASAALGSEISSPQTHAPVGHLDEGLSDILTRMVQEGTITQEQMDQHLDKAEEHINAVLNGERPWGMHKGKNRSHGRDRGKDQRFRPNRGGDTQIDSETTAH